jgi:IS4 transposase
MRRTYAQRWQIESLFKELKSHYRLDQLPSSNRHVVRALIWAAVLSLVVSRRFLLRARAKIEVYAEDADHATQVGESP